MKFFTLHIRLTRDCNAHCDYCSSAGVSAGRMSGDEFKVAMDFIVDRVFPRIGVGSQHFVTVEYLGGEILLVPQGELEAAAMYARKKIGNAVRGIRDGAQSNLIATPRRVMDLHDLFAGNLGTSWDRHTGQRHIKGSVDLYNGLLDRSLASLEQERDFKPGRVFVLDAAGGQFVEREVEDAIKGGYDLVIRPVFQGGSEGVKALRPAEVAELMAKCYRIWRTDPRVRIEPFFSLHQRRMNRNLSDEHGYQLSEMSAGCPFQSDCAFRSLSLDPDGTLHVCQEMADAGNYPLGNALSQTFDEKTWRLLARRSARLSSDCRVCPWKTECGGGCMNEAIEAHGDPFAKTELCPAWKAIFHEIETYISLGDAGHAARETV